MEESNAWKYFCELYPNKLPTPTVCIKNGDYHYLEFKSNDVTINLSLDLSQLDTKIVKYKCTCNTLEGQSELCGNFLDDKDYDRLKKIFTF